MNFPVPMVLSPSLGDSADPKDRSTSGWSGTGEWFVREFTQQVADAFEALDLQPCQDNFFVAFDGGCCCPLTALALAEKVVDFSDPSLTADQRTNPVFFWAVGKFGRNWVLGFLDGWDWRYPGKSAPQNDPAYREGFESGKHVLKSLVMTERTDETPI